MSAFSVSDDLEFAFRLADAAGAAILPFFRQNCAVDNKDTRAFDPVTEADRAAERVMREMIGTHRPGDGILGEEYPETPSQNTRGWTLDPIDGTRAFLAGSPTWTVLIAHTRHSVPEAGVVDQPHTGERFFGDRRGASLSRNGEIVPLSVSQVRALDQSLLATTDPYLFADDEAKAFSELRRAARLTRFSMDAYAYAMLASGQVDLVVETDLKPFDVQALLPVVEGAGGILTNWHGDSAHMGGQVIAAATAELHAAALTLLEPAAR